MITKRPPTRFPIKRRATPGPSFGRHHPDGRPRSLPRKHGRAYPANRHWKRKNITQSAAMFRIGGIITMKECSAVRLREGATLDFGLQALWCGGEVRCKVLSRLRNIKTGFAAASIHHQTDRSGARLARVIAYRVPALVSAAAAPAASQCSPGMRGASSRLGRRWVGSLRDGSRMSNLLTKLD
jgi:hypothetical protein